MNIKNYNTQLSEDLDTSSDPNIAGTDANLNLTAMYQQLNLPSLARTIFPVTNMPTGPSGKIFCLREKSDAQELELVSSILEVYPSESVKTSITLEALEDIYAMYGIKGYKAVARMLRSEANKLENSKLIEFLQANCSDEGTLTLTDSENAIIVLSDISGKVQELVLKANSVYKRTFSAFAVVPYTYLSKIMASVQFMNGSDDIAKSNLGDLSAVKIGFTTYYLNPDPDDEYIYVGLRYDDNPGTACAYFGAYQNTLQEAIDYDTGLRTFFIFDRFGMTASPLHTDESPMMFMFQVA